MTIKKKTTTKEKKRGGGGGKLFETPRGPQLRTQGLGKGKKHFSIRKSGKPVKRPDRYNYSLSQQKKGGGGEGHVAFKRKSCKKKVFMLERNAQESSNPFYSG